MEESDSNSKINQNNEKLIAEAKRISDLLFFDVEKLKVANLPKRALPKFHADRSQVRGVNGRSKLAVAAVRSPTLPPPSSTNWFRKQNRSL